MMTSARVCRPLCCQWALWAVVASWRATAVGGEWGPREALEEHRGRRVPPGWRPPDDDGGGGGGGAAAAAPSSNAAARSLTREPGVSVSCDARGNLGPCEVVIQSMPGPNWLKDRWQAASDMGGASCARTRGANEDAL